MRNDLDNKGISTFSSLLLIERTEEAKKNERAFYSLGQVANPNEGDEKLFILFLFWHTFFHSFSSIARYTIRCVH